jgi:adenylyl-sulfate kinase
MSAVLPHAFWLFGLSGAGKSTLATRLSRQIRADGIPVLSLDGDDLRAGLCLGLGFSDSDRAENLRRSAEVAKLALRSGISVVASFITPLENHRQLIQGIFQPAELSFIFVSAPLEVCRNRDVKGLYAEAKAGKVGQMAGMTSAFEIPRHPDLTLATAELNVETCVAQLVDFSRQRLTRPQDTQT